MLVVISRTDFVDIVSKSGTPKATKVAQVKARPDYMPAFDFYKPLREAIIELHQQNKEKKALHEFCRTLGDRKKLVNYPAAIEGYKKWWGKKEFVWFEPPRASYTANGIEVAVNPELGLFIKGQPHVIKLYFKGDPLSKLRVDLITVLMEVTLRSMSCRGEVMAVLDVRNAKLFTLAAPISLTKAVVDAQE